MFALVPQLENRLRGCLRETRIRWSRNHNKDRGAGIDGGEQLAGGNQEDILRMRVIADTEDGEAVWISRPIHKRGWIVEYYPGKMLHLIGPPVPGRLLLIAPKCVSRG